MEITKDLILSIMQLASAEDAADEDLLAEHVRLTLDNKKAMIARYQELVTERAALMATVTEIDNHITDMQGTCTHALTANSTCLICGSTV